MDAYERGRAAVLKGENLNKSAPDQSYWLAMAVPVARAALANEQVADLTAPPEWDALNMVEQRCLEAAWGALSGSHDTRLWDYGFLRFEARWMDLYVKNYFEQLQKLVLNQAVLEMPEACEMRFLAEAWNALNSTAWPHFVIAIIILKSTHLENRHGALRQALPDPRDYKKDMEEKDLVRWMAEFSDPDFWHIYARQPRIQLMVVGWILEQPECDIATVAHIFERLSGPVWYDAFTKGFWDADASGPEVQRIRAIVSPVMAAMCENIFQRVSDGFYERTELAYDMSSAPYGITPMSGTRPEPLFPGKESGRDLRTPLYVQDARYIRVSLI